MIDVYIFSDRADAADEYRLGVITLEYREDRLNATLAPTDGWWDEGRHGEIVRDVPEGQYDLEQGEASRIDVEYIIRHENLYVRAHVDALSATRDVKEANAVLHTLLAAFLDETAGHLTLTMEE